MATLHSYENIDPEKSISLLTHLARASKRIFEKELARKHIIYYGAEAYYKILFEAMKSGFKG